MNSSGLVEGARVWERRSAIERIPVAETVATLSFVGVYACIVAKHGRSCRFLIVLKKDDLNPIGKGCPYSPLHGLFRDRARAIGLEERRGFGHNTGSGSCERQSLNHANLKLHSIGNFPVGNPSPIRCGGALCRPNRRDAPETVDRRNLERGFPIGRRYRLRRSPRGTSCRRSRPSPGSVAGDRGQLSCRFGCRGSASQREEGTSFPFSVRNNRQICLIGRNH